MKKVCGGVDIGGTNTVFGWVESNGNFLYKGSVKTKDFDDPKRFSEGGMPSFVKQSDGK